jgi:hypothetical protein
MSSEGFLDSATQHQLPSGKSAIVLHKEDKLLKLNQAASFIFKNVDDKDLPYHYAEAYGDNSRVDIPRDQSIIGVKILIGLREGQ